MEKFLSADGDRTIHPVTRPAFLRSVKTNSLDFKILVDQLVKIDIARDNIAPSQRGRATLHFERAAKFIKNFQRKKCDLSFVIIFEIKVAITADAATGHAFDRPNLDRRKLIWVAAVVADKIMAR